METITATITRIRFRDKTGWTAKSLRGAGRNAFGGGCITQRKLSEGMQLNVTEEADRNTTLFRGAA